MSNMKRYFNKNRYSYSVKDASGKGKQWRYTEERQQHGILPKIRRYYTVHLTKQLRELEQDGFVSRYVYQEVSTESRIFFNLVRKSFVPILQDMKKWSDIHLM